MGKFYITTAIDYANAAPHLGHAYEKVIADVFARWHRAQNDETFFLTGTDEHGAKIARAAEKAGSAPADFVAKHRQSFQDLLTTLNVSNDDFIYTADQKRHWPGAQKLWKKLVDAGDIYKATYKGLYCVGHEAFVTEKDLVGGICADHQQKPELIEEENYFFKLSKYTDRVRATIESGEFHILPEARKKEVLAFLDEGVGDISFSRPSKDISWGIPVPGDFEHTMYVWADALSNYISVLGYGRADEALFQKFWPADMHIIGKDILRFHAIYWPAMLMAADLSLPKALFVHGMILSSGKKMSKTIGNVIDPIEIVNEYGADAFRYFVMREIPLGEDGDFTRERFAAVYEGSLAHGIGNLVSRVSAMIAKNFPGGVVGELEDLGLPKKAFGDAMSAYALTEALSLLMRFFSSLDAYIQKNEPYRLVKTDVTRASAVLWNLAQYLRESRVFLEPFMPHTAHAINEIFEVSKEGRICAHIRGALFPSKKST